MSSLAIVPLNLQQMLGENMSMFLESQNIENQY